MDYFVKSSKQSYEIILLMPTLDKTIVPKVTQLAVEGGPTSESTPLTTLVMPHFSHYI